MGGKVLVPLDGNDLSEAALPFAEELAVRLGSPLVLLRTPPSGNGDNQPARWMYLDRLAQSVEGQLGELSTERGQTSVATVLSPRGATGTVCDLVSHNDTGFITMAATGRPGLAVSKALGCAADHSCRTIPVPVMLIGPKALERVRKFGHLINRLMVVVDDSLSSRVTLPVAADMARSLNVGITLFAASRVIVPFAYADDGGGNFTDYALIVETEKRRRAGNLSTLAADLGSQGVDVDYTLVPGFKTAGEIIAAARRAGADVIVIGPDERPRILRRIFGSLTADLLRQGDMPVVQVQRRAT